MSQRVRTAITLSVLGVLLLGAGLWGWSAATDPLPAKVDSPVCVTTEVQKGEKVFPEQVTVSVYNAGTREGLAGLTMQLLTDAGFAKGNSGNAPRSKVRTVAIWSADPASPAVVLLRSRFGSAARVVERDGPGAGITVLVGDEFTRLGKGRGAVIARADTEICSPPVS